MNALPPLLALSKGRKVRPRRAPSISKPKELTAIHIPVAKLLKEHCLRDWRYTHFPAGEKRDKRTASKLKAMGMQPGIFDFLIFSPTGQLHCLEVKRSASAKLNRNQESFRLWCVKGGVPYAVAWTIDQVLLAFGRWGCLRVHVPSSTWDQSFSEYDHE